jgi:hypothetical protein
MPPFSTALHHLSRFWGSLSRYIRKVKTASDTVTVTPSSPAPQPSTAPQYRPQSSPAPQSPQKKILLGEEPRHADDFYITDPSLSFGLFWLHRGPTSDPVETEEDPVTVSYEEVLVAGQKRIATYEEWCRVTNVSMI